MWGGETITFEREALYEEVWSEPLRILAERYGVSDVCLGKICVKLAVPRPGRGYWAKAAAGKSPRRTRLPKLKKGAPEHHSLWRRHPSSAPQRKNVDDCLKLVLPAPIAVAEILAEPHQLVARTQRQLAKAKPEKGTVRGRLLGVLDLRVSPRSLDRALRLLDALLKGMESVGLKVEINQAAKPARARWGQHEQETPDYVTRVCCHEEWIPFALWERVRRDEDPKPKVKPRRSAWGGTYTPWQPTTYTYTPTGLLTLELTNTCVLPVRHAWRDGKRQRLEDCVGPFIAHLGIVAQAIKDDRAESERRYLAMLERDRREEEERARRQMEQKRLARLVDEAERWDQAKKLGAYAHEGLRLLSLLTERTEADEARRRELEWLLAYAERLNPLRSS